VHVVNDQHRGSTVCPRHTASLLPLDQHPAQHHSVQRVPGYDTSISLHLVESITVRPRKSQCDTLSVTHVSATAVTTATWLSQAFRVMECCSSVNSICMYFQTQQFC
jgi:hypothetical protein